MKRRVMKVALDTLLIVACVAVVVFCAFVVVSGWRYDDAREEASPYPWGESMNRAENRLATIDHEDRIRALRGELDALKVSVAALREQMAENHEEVLAELDKLRDALETGGSHAE